MQINASTDIQSALAQYGVRFEGDQSVPDYSQPCEFLPLSELVAQGGKVTRVRWIGGDYIPGRGRCYDLSYVHGVLPSGMRVSVTHLPAAFLVPRRGLKGALIEWAKEERVFAKGCGLLDESNFSILG